MSIIFIAVQCFQCSTMQVKQKKKSSNKWSCVVCNEKQSVQKVFAQGFMAKDVRKYVQSFNMSRQIAEQDSLLSNQALAAPEAEEIEDDFISNQKKKRTDWSEYIDPEKEVEIEDDSEDVFEPMIVTELPKALLKKPKLNNYVADFDTDDGEKPPRPVFGKRNASKKTNSVDKEEPNTSRAAMRKEASRWSDCKKQAAQHFGYKEPLVSQRPTAIGALKWIDYIAREEEEEEGHEDCFANKRNESSRLTGAPKWNNFMTEDELLLESGKDVGDKMGQLNDSVAFDTRMNDQIVEDDIHPDFQ